MQSYSPYRKKSSTKKKFNFKLPDFKDFKLKKPLLIVLGAVAGLFFVIYLSLGELRFFANHYLGLTFFSKNYVVLFQNNYELRPGGGFITAYGNLDTFMAFPKSLKFHNSYDIDTENYVTPPYPHEEMLKNEWYQGYTFRDANWESDFPNATADIIDFYQKKFPNADVDGIIVVNFSLIEDLVDVLGNVELNGKTLNRNNLFNEIEFAVNNVDRHNEEALKNRKNVLGELAGKLMGKAKWHPFKTKKIIVQGLENKDLYLWLKKNRLQKKIQEKGWANHLAVPEKSDFLAINLANLGSKKADRYIQKEVHHYVNITKEIPEVTTEVALRFPGFTNSYSDNYKGYLRLHTPKNAILKEKPVDTVIESGEKWSTMGTQVILPAGSKTHLTYTYTLPRTLLNNKEYQLRLIKQSGSQAHYNVTVEAPSDSLMESADFETRENRAFFSGELQSDRDLNLRILPDTTPPYPIEQVFEDLNTIKIVWSEPLDAASGNDALHYMIRDTNLKNETNDEAVKVVYAEMTEPNVSRLEIEGITRQDLERYELTLKNLHDQAGNEISPSPKVVTVVQRFAANTDIKGERE